MRRAFRSTVACALGLLAGGPWTFADESGPPPFGPVAHILHEHCADCHRPGDIGPMPLLTYEQVRPWAKSIAREVAAGNMPPFPAEGPIGRYRNDPRLTDGETALITEWVKAGARRGDPALIPLPPPALDNDWRLGEPDLVVTLPSHVVRPDDPEDYVNLYPNFRFLEDFWVDAIEWKIGNRSVLHHGTLHVQLYAEDFGGPPGDVFEDVAHTYLPASYPKVFDDEEALMIPRHARLRAEIHYAPAETAQADQTSIGFYAANGPRYARSRDLTIQFKDIDIAPNTSEYVRRDRREFSDATVVTGFRFHMHLRGRSARIDLHYPDGLTETAIEVPRYDFDWQYTYLLNEPLEVPAGTVAEFVAVWDNSPDNERNPDPNRRIQYGTSTKDEMGGGHVLRRPAVRSGPPVLIEQGRRVEEAGG